MKTNWLQDAQNNWPEDEASSEAEFVNAIISEGESVSTDLKDRIVKHWSAVFDGEPDAAELMARFVTAYNKQVPDYCRI